MKNNKKNMRREAFGNSLSGSLSRAPRLIGSQQPQSLVRVKDRIERRVLKLAYDVAGTASGPIELYVATSVPGFAPRSTTNNTVTTILPMAPDIEDFSMFRIKRVEVIYTPTVAITTTPVPLYSGYEAVATPSGGPSFSYHFGYSNGIRFISRETASYIYNVKPPSTLNSSNAYSVLEGGWINNDALTLSPVETLANFPPGYIFIRSNAATLITFRVEINYLVELKGRRNDLS